MTLPTDFLFSQNKLQDYLDCPRRFELRYIERMAWPAVQSEPVEEMERSIRLGERFHRMVQQHNAGIPAEQIDPQANEPELALWWDSYKQFAPSQLPAQRLAEYSLTVPFGGYRLAAKYDLLAVEPGRAVIVDWKTGRGKPNREILKQRVQTRVYMALLVMAGGYRFPGMGFQPHQVEMLYWYSSEPDQPVRIAYSPWQYEQDVQQFTSWFGKIASTPSGGFFQTTNDKSCRYCNYRSLCERGVAAPQWDESEDWDAFERGEFNLDFDLIEPAQPGG
jgi:RecB family exonuclease